MDLKALYLCSYGLYVIASRRGDKLNGQIANTVFQVTAEPPTVAVSINKENLTHQYISESKAFTASIISTEAPMTFIGKWGFKSGRDIDKFADSNHRPGTTGAPIVLDYAVAYIEVSVLKTLDVGTHTLFVGKVVDCNILKAGEPMTYAFYHQVKKGKTPKRAATFQAESERKESPKDEGKRANRYRCLVCGYIYDPDKGDPDSGVPPGTAFEDIPGDWVCPVCGAGRDQFEPVA